jgi:hypothetical protein
MIKFEEGKLYCFKAADMSRMFGECIERNELNGTEFAVFRFPKEGLFCKCLVYYLTHDIEEYETVLCYLGDKMYMSDSRWVSE